METKRTSTVLGIVLKKVIPLLIIALLILAAVAVQKAKNSEQEEEQFNKQQVTHPSPNAGQYHDKLVAENDNYELYLDGTTLSVTIRDKASGAMLESAIAEDDGKNNAQWIGFMKSGIVLNVIDGLNENAQADFVNNTADIAIEDIENGFHAYVTFPDYEISFELLVSLTEDSLEVEIPDQSIVENSEKYHIGAINVFPFLGSTYLGETAGYMFIPDGNGALIHLNDKEGKLSGGYSKMVYGDDIGFKESEVESLLWGYFETVNEEENILAPIFGMVHTDQQLGYLGIIESGEERAGIEAYPNGVVLDYNRIYPKFILRKVYVQPTSQSNSGTIEQIEKDRSHYDIKVKYCLVRGEDANYTGMAVRYRNYLLEEGGLSVKDNSYNTRIDFLGTERENWLITKMAVTMTTTEDIQDIYKDLEASGVADLLFLYKGWQSGGLYKLPIKSYKADGTIGGTSKLTKLIKQIKDSGNRLYLYQDVLRSNPDENNTTFNLVKRINKRLYEEYSYQYVYDTFMYLTPARTNYYLKKLEKDFMNKGVTQISLAGITNSIYSYSYKGNFYSRTDTMTDYEAAVSSMDTDFDLVLDQPFSYLWKYTDAFLDMPIGTSNYNFTDEEIPFLSIALKGIMPMYSDYVNFEANKQEYFLKLVEMGIYPSFYITKEDSSELIYTNSADVYSSKYTTYKNDIIDYSDELKKVNDAVKDAFIIDHKRLDSGVTVVSYDNGINVYINYSNTDQTVDGYLIEAMSYKVGEAK